MAVDLKIGGKAIRLISVYMCHSGYSNDDLQHCFDELSSLTMQAQDGGASIIIGDDFNIALGGGFRASVLRGFCYQFGLIITDRTNDELGSNDRAFRHSTVNLHRIDYILMSEYLIFEDVCACEDIQLGSDHRALR